MKVINKNGTAIDFETAFSMMDDDIRESVHAELAPSLHRAGVFTAYEKRTPRSMESGSLARKILVIKEDVL